jgi:nucleoside phosphorylase
MSGGHLYEHKAAHSLYRDYIGLFLRGHIAVVAAAKSVDEFVSSKAAQYSHAMGWEDRNYSVYSLDQWKKTIKGPVSFLPPTVDTTTELASALSNEIGDGVNLDELAREILKERNSRAITIALFQHIPEFSDLYLSHLASLISKNYQLIYRHKYAPWIFAKSGLIIEEIEATISTEHKLPIYQYIYESMGLSRMYDTAGFRIEQFRGSIEQVRLVCVMRRLFSDVERGESWKIGKIFKRLLDSSDLYPNISRTVEDQCYRISNILEPLGNVSFPDLYNEISRANPQALIYMKPVEATQRLPTDVKYDAFVVVAAQQELRYVREYLKQHSIAMEAHTPMAGRSGTAFYLPAGNGSQKRVGLMVASSQGRESMSELLEAISSNEKPQLVIMVGMMAGIQNKAKLLDVIAPKTVYDGTAIGTRDGAVVAEPEAADIDPLLHQWLLDHDWGDDEYSQDINVILHKKTVTVSAKIDDVTHELAQAALCVDRENVIGLEMEGIALANRQKRNQLVPDTVRYLMVKGVADYAGKTITNEDCDQLPDALKAIAVVHQDPIRNKDLRLALQKEATWRAMSVARSLLEKGAGSIPDVVH